MNIRELKKTLKDQDTKVICTCCGKPYRAGQLGFFYQKKFTAEAESFFNDKLEVIRAEKKRLEGLKEHISGQTTKKAKEINTGFIYEKIAPILNSFPFHIKDCRYLGSPIDFIVFEGLHKQDVKHIHFLELKTGNSRLNSNQRKVRNAVNQGKVFYDQYKS